VSHQGFSGEGVAGAGAVVQFGVTVNIHKALTVYFVVGPVRIYVLEKNHEIIIYLIVMQKYYLLVLVLYSVHISIIVLV